MLKEHITIQNKLGLHTRAAAKLVSTAAKFESKIEILLPDRHVDCKSIMSLILVGAKKGTELTFSISGADELEARDAIFGLINGRFEEAE